MYALVCMSLLDHQPWAFFSPQSRNSASYLVLSQGITVSQNAWKSLAESLLNWNQTFHRTVLKNQGRPKETNSNTCPLGFFLLLSVGSCFENHSVREKKYCSFNIQWMSGTKRFAYTLRISFMLLLWEGRICIHGFTIKRCGCWSLSALL